MLFSGDGRRRREILGSLDPRRRDVVGPGQNDRDRKPEDEREDDQPHGPVRDFEKWKDLGRDLDQNPATTT